MFLFPEHIHLQRHYHYEKCMAVDLLAPSMFSYSKCHCRQVSVSKSQVSAASTVIKYKSNYFYYLNTGGKHLKIPRINNNL